LFLSSAALGSIGQECNRKKCQEPSAVQLKKKYFMPTQKGNVQLVRFRHKGLRHLYENGNAKGVPSAMADKLGKLLLALETAEALEQLGRFPGWRLNPLKGQRKGSWSLTVTGNWRLVFRYDEEMNTASEIDLIDYH